MQKGEKQQHVKHVSFKGKATVLKTCLASNRNKTLFLIKNDCISLNQNVSTRMFCFLLFFFEVNA